MSASGSGRRGWRPRRTQLREVGLLCRDEVRVELVVVLDGEDGQVELAHLVDVLLGHRPEANVLLRPAQSDAATHRGSAIMVCVCVCGGSGTRADA